MARTYKKPAKADAAQEAVNVAAPETAEPSEKPAETQTEAARPVMRVAARVPVKAAESVIASPGEEVMQKIVYQPSSQILTREADPSESFGVGDDMPIYYL
ncbi:MAG: hypothetical protein J5966_08285 [Lachnospiraceae bacterium]|nr:hypothetical protein [Lachnospiraceae bacterium]